MTQDHVRTKVREQDHQRGPGPCPPGPDSRLGPHSGPTGTSLSGMLGTKVPPLRGTMFPSPTPPRHPARGQLASTPRETEPAGHPAAVFTFHDPERERALIMSSQSKASRESVRVSSERMNAALRRGLGTDLPIPPENPKHAALNADIRRQAQRGLVHVDASDVVKPATDDAGGES
jgi:hypothetical protein